MTRIILIALVLLVGGTASAQNDSHGGSGKSKSPKKIRDEGVKAQESGEFQLAEKLFTDFLDLDYDKDIITRLGTVRLQQGDTIGFCRAMGSPGIKSELFKSYCLIRDSMEFTRSGLSTQTYYGTKSVTKQLNRGTDRTTYTLYNEMGEETLAFFTNNKDTVYYNADQPALFPGGTDSLYTYLGKNVVYPRSARDNDIQGTVYIEFIVKADGHITNARMMRGVCRSINAEAMRVINAMPNWTPSYYQGGPVNSIFLIPIKFSVQ